MSVFEFSGRVGANPYASLGKEGDELYMGDNFERMNGDASSQMQQTFHTVSTLAPSFLPSLLNVRGLSSLDFSSDSPTT